MSVATTSQTRALPEWRRFRFPQSLYKYGALIAALAFIYWSLGILRIDVERLPGMLGRMGEVLGDRYWPPAVSHVLEASYLQAVVDTFQMSYVATVIDAFGPKRVMFATNWPVLEVGGTYAGWVRTFQEIVADLGLSAADTAQMLSATATRAYGLKPS